MQVNAAYTVHISIMYKCVLYIYMNINKGHHDIHVLRIFMNTIIDVTLSVGTCI